MTQDGDFTVARLGDATTLTLVLGAAALAYVVRDHLSTPFDSLFDAAGKKYNVPSNLLRAIGRRESGFRTTARNPATGAYPNGSFDVGVMQINTITGAKLGYSVAQLSDPATSIEAAARVLAENRNTLGARFSSFTWPASYNVGPANVSSTVGEAYAASVLYHWQLYDLGRMFA